MIAVLFASENVTLIAWSLFALSEIPASFKFQSNVVSESLMNTTVVLRLIDNVPAPV